MRWINMGHHREALQAQANGKSQRGAQELLREQVLTIGMVQHFGLFPFGQMFMKSSLSFGTLLASCMYCQADTLKQYIKKR